jgi:hypothetical protein
MRHDLDAAEPQRFVQPIEFGHGKLGGLERNRAEPDKAVGVAGANLGDEIVDRARRGKTEIGVGAIIGLARCG